MSAVAKWWDESRRGRLVGHAIRTGAKWRHVLAITEVGPAAVDIRSLCRRGADLTVVDTGLDLNDQADREAFMRSRTMPEADVELRATCPKCIERLAAQRTKAVAS